MVTNYDNITIHPFPAPGDNNMFLKLFYSEVDLHTLHNAKFRVEPLSLWRIINRVRKDKESRHIIHVHWVIVLFGSRLIIKSIYLMVINFSVLFILKKVCGVKICWTMHNFKSHDYPHPLMDKMGRRIMLALADGVIIQQKSVAEEWRKRFVGKNIKYISLGSYANAYRESSLSVHEIRSSYGLNGHDIVILSFGIVKPYKKIDEIIGVFKSLSDRTDARIKLLIVGTATDKYGEHIRRLIADSPRVIFKNIFTKDSGVADVLRMADYSIFWYDDSVLTSGGLALALSYGLPAIIRNIPAAERIVPNRNGFIFNNAEQLREILEKLARIEKPSREQAMESIINDSWSVKGQEFMAYCLELCGNK